MEEFYFNPQGGKLNLEERELFMFHIEGLPPRRHVLVVKQYRNLRSDPQRKFYFSAVLTPFGEAQGYDKTELLFFHHQLKGLFFNIQPDRFGMYKNLPAVFGEDSDLDTKRKTEFIDFVLREAARNDVDIQV